MTVPNVNDCEGPRPPPPPPPTISTTPSASSSPRLTKEATTDNNPLLADIRNGIKLKPTKTKDKSTPAFIKKSNGSGKVSPAPHSNGTNGDVSIVDMKDALQQELRNTLKRKVKTQDVEQGNCTKKEEIEKAMEINRTEIQLKINGSSPTAPYLPKKDIVDSPKTHIETNHSNGITTNGKPSEEGSVSQSAHLKLQNKLEDNYKPVVADQTAAVIVVKENKDSAKENLVTNENVSSVKKISKVFINPVFERPPTHIERAKPSNSTENTKPTNDSTKLHTPVKIEIKPFDSSRTPLRGTLRTVSSQKALTIDTSVSQDDRLKNTILSPDVKSGNAAIRPSQIKSLTQQGSHVSHTDILENPKPISKSPIAIGETPPYIYSPPTPKTISPASSGLSSPRTPTRTTILDTKYSNSLKKASHASPNIDQSGPQKLMMTHPKATFTLKRNALPNGLKEDSQKEPKPVFRILTNLEQTERLETTRDGLVKQEPPKADEPGEEPILTSYVSFSKELANAPNNYPDVVAKQKTVGVVKQDLFFDNMNLRDIKIDIIEGGDELKVVNK